jgi:GTPase SAR1 family protein
MKKFNQVDSYVNVLLLGQSGVGKSTLAQVIIKRAIRTSFLGLVRNVSGIEPFTAGIIPTAVHRHKEFGNIILHDFAGHPEYYSSHTAVIENLLQGAGAVFVIVVDITLDESLKHLQQWLTIVNNEVQKSISQCHIIVVASHIDKMPDSTIKNKRVQELSSISA